MEQIRQVMKQMINVSEDELNDFLSQAVTKTFKRQEIFNFIDFSKGTPADGAKLEIVQLDDRNDPNAQSILLESVDLDVQ